VNASRHNLDSAQLEINIFELNIILILSALNFFASYNKAIMLHASFRCVCSP
jgi:hypothetical protein